MFPISLERSLSKNENQKNETTAARLNIEVSFLPPFPSLVLRQQRSWNVYNIFESFLDIFIQPCPLSRSPYINDNVLIARFEQGISRIEQRIKGYSNPVVGWKRKKNFAEEFILCRNQRDSRVDGPDKNLIRDPLRSRVVFFFFPLNVLSAS